MNFHLLTKMLILYEIKSVFGITNKIIKLQKEGNNNLDTKNEKSKQDHKCSSNPNFVWCLPSNYTNEENPFEHATNEKKLPWNYTFYFGVKGIDKIDDQSQSVSIRMYFGVRWFEPRLIINEKAKAWGQVKLGPPGEVTISTQNLDELWYPELEIYGIESFKVYKVLKEMSGLRVRKDRTINYELKVEVTITCQMEFDNYPFDEQECLFQVGSYYGSNETIRCNTKLTNDNPRQKNIQHSIRLMPLPRKNSTITVTSGSYATCGFSIKLARKRMQNFVQIFMPSFMFVIVSWISFIVNPEVVPGRMALLITIVLVQLNLFNDTKNKAPTSGSNFNAVDLYLIFCMFLVFSALLEYAVILFLMKMLPTWTLKVVDETKFKGALRRDNATHDLTTLGGSKKFDIREVSSTVSEDHHHSNTTNRGQPENPKVSDVKLATDYVCKKIDVIALCLTPVVFTIFHFIYLFKFL